MRLDKGDILEYRCFRLLAHTGYLVMKGLLVYTTEMLNQVTDIDLFGIRYDLDFSRDIIIIESKNRKKLGSLDRILWLKGLKNLVGAKSAILAVPNIKWDIKDYAYKEGIKIIDSTSLNHIESSLNLSERKYFALADYEFYEPIYPTWKPILSYDNRLSRVFSFINSDAKNLTPHKGINRLFSEIKWLLPKLKANKKNEAQLTKWLLYRITVYLSIYMLDLCQYIQLLNNSERAGFLQKVFTFGDIPQSLAGDILNEIWNIAKRLSNEQFGKAISIPEEFYKFPVPSYYEGVLEVLNRFCKNPKSAIKSPRILDFILFEFLFKEKEIEVELLKNVLDIQTDLDIKQAKNVLNLLIKYGDIPSEFYGEFLAL